MFPAFGRVGLPSPRTDAPDASAAAADAVHAAREEAAAGRAAYRAAASDPELRAKAQAHLQMSDIKTRVQMGPRGEATTPYRTVTCAGHEVGVLRMGVHVPEDERGRSMVARADKGFEFLQPVLWALVEDLFEKQQANRQQKRTRVAETLRLPLDPET